MKDLKYLTSFIIPVLVLIGLNWGGLYAFMGVGFAFVVIPLVEPLFQSSKENIGEEEASKKLKNSFFDWLLYVNLPLMIVVLMLFSKWIYLGDFHTYELVGQILSVGTFLGANGINVAHELGHRFNRIENVIAQALLLPTFYMHFFIEHNLGHHKNVATPEDPATAKINEPLYKFWVRSSVNSYIDAWTIERNRLSRLKKNWFSFKNRMLVYAVAQISYLFIVGIFFSWFTCFILMITGTFGFLLLETINYIEHYGLSRKKLENGRYERVTPQHSWNSNHELGRIVLYELTRHSDHHFISSKKFQVLDHHENSPQLPYGYPTSMLISLVPPLWFQIMNPRLESR